MHIKNDKFCFLATSPLWQTWLYNNHTILYKKFIYQLQESHGCNQNSQIMSEILSEIIQINDKPLIAFLQEHYPHVVCDQHKSINQQDDLILKNDGVFQYYNPNILTYPRRQIFVGQQHILKNKVKEFLIDKIHGDYIIIGERVYIEYLEKNDAIIASQIPTKNWLINQYKLRH